VIWRLFLLLMLSAASPAFAQRIELPVRMVTLPNGDRRFATSIMIDGRSVEVGIDTGSTGLRVLPRGLGETGRAAKGPRLSYSYGAGTGFEGDAVSVQVAAGAVAGPVKIMRITAVGCTADHPECPVARADLSAYGIQGDGLAGQGFAAILGIRLERDAIGNPFEQLGVRQWVIELPRSPDETGRIILNPGDAEIAAYARVGVDADGTAPGCLAGPDKICGRVFFDSGAAGLRVLSAAPFRIWPNGTPATITFGAGGQAQKFNVIIGRRDQASGLMYAPRRADKRVSLGFAPYFVWSVLYDADRNQIGVKAR
jgi:hypothetical protein